MLWWLGDLAGALVVTPVVVLWERNLIGTIKQESLIGLLFLILVPLQLDSLRSVLCANALRSTGKQHDHWKAV